MAGLPFLDVVDIDLIAELRDVAGPIHCAQVKDIRAHDLVQANTNMRVGRHLVIMPTAGVGRHVVEMTDYVVEPGSVLHIEPGRAHRWVPEATFDGWVIAIDQHVCPLDLFDVNGLSPLVALGASIDVAHALIVSLTKPNVLPAGAQQRLRLSIASVLLELIAGASDRTMLPTDAVAEQKLVGDFRRELEFHYLSTRSVGDYAKLIGCSTKTLTRATKRVLGQTPKETIDLRVAYAACRLLSNTDISVAWIANNLGFSEQSNFAKFFSRLVGTTPAAYRNDCRSETIAN